MGADWLGLGCECHLNGELVRADVRELTQTSLAIDTTEPFAPGDEFELRLAGGVAKKPVYIRVVVDAHVPVSALGADSNPAVRFRLLDFSEEYALLLGGTSGSGMTNASVAENDRQLQRAGESEWASDLAGYKPKTPTTKREKKVSEEWEDYEPLLERAGVPLWSDDPVPPEAIVVDDGELSDVVRVLCELGVKTERRSPTADFGLSNWQAPQKLLVVTANQALRLRLPLQGDRKGFVSIAVADSDARMACAALRRLGYHYVVTRPIHPFAMSMLFAQAIFPDVDQRLAPRQVLGCDVRWWGRWPSRRRGVLLDVSPTGCQLMIEGAAPEQKRINIRVPGQVTGSKSFTLSGRVLRENRSRANTRLGIAFDLLTEGKQDQLRLLTTLPGPVRIGDTTLIGSEGPQATNANAEVDRRDRRSQSRAAMNQEVVALDESGQIKHVLLSRDLSLEGMRVEAHPDLQLDEQLKVALYEDPQGDPLVIHALAARDDGRAGWWLRFVGVTPEAREWLARSLERFPAVTRLDETPSDEGRVVLGQVLLNGRRTSDDLD